jgi:hypothetical protein
METQWHCIPRHCEALKDNAKQLPGNEAQILLSE